MAVDHAATHLHDRLRQAGCKHDLVPQPLLALDEEHCIGLPPPIRKPAVRTPSIGLPETQLIVFPRLFESLQQEQCKGAMPARRSALRVPVDGTLVARDRLFDAPQVLKRYTAVE